MKPDSIRKNSVVLLVAAAATLVMGVTLFGTLTGCNKSRWMAPAGMAEKVSKFSAQGALMLPEGYREWIFVGAPVTPNDMNNGKAAFPEFHNVYIDPPSFAAYQKTGKFPDGTVPVKELVSVGAKSAPSGNGYFEGEFLGLEVSVKDSGRFPDEPGYWAYFRFSQEDHSLPYKSSAMAFPAATCNACHQAAAAQDWVFTQFYPVLREAKAQ